MRIDFKPNGNGQMVTGNAAGEAGRAQPGAANGPLRSEAIQEIISRRPGFLEQWALPVFLLVLAALLAGTWYIRYPEVVQASASLMADNAPKEIVTRQDGRLISLVVANDEVLSEGQTIGWIESTASHKEVLLLDSLLARGAELLSGRESEKVSALFEMSFHNLGELQSAYQQFVQAWQQFNDYLASGYFYKKKRMFHEDLAYLEKMHRNLDSQIGLTMQDSRLAKEAFDADSTLYRDKVISKQDLRDQQSKWVGRQVSIRQLESGLLGNENAQVDKRKEIAELEHTISQQKTIFEQALQTLKSLTEDWERKFILRAPAGGRVVFTVPLQENQFLQNGKTIGYINPPDTRYYAQVLFQQSNFGKVDSGQSVQLRIDAYPYQEFGFVPGRLTYVSKIPSDSGYMATAVLPKGLLTNYNRAIHYRSGLKSQALVVTRNTRLIERLFNNVLKIKSLN